MWYDNCIEQTPNNITPIGLEIKNWLDKTVEIPIEEDGSFKKSYVQRWREKNREKFNASVGRQNYNIRLQVLKHYGGDSPKCKFCPMDNPNCLLVGGKRNVAWIKRLRQKKYPEGLEIVCLNCNQNKETR